MWRKQGYMEGIVLDMSAIASPRDPMGSARSHIFLSLQCMLWLEKPFHRSLNQIEAFWKITIGVVFDIITEYE
jgi:hypothetical protein